MTAINCTCAALGRTWTGASDKHTIEAELVGFQDGLLHLKKTDGTEIKIPLESCARATKRSFSRRLRRVARASAATRLLPAALCVFRSLATPGELEMAITIQQVISQIPAWAGKTASFQPLSGGLTNANYRVEIDGTPYFVRIPGASTELLAVDRINEHYNSRAAGETGVCPKVLYHLPEHHVMVLEFIRGETMTIEALQRPGNATRLAQSLRRLHAGPRFRNDFNMFRLVDFYLTIVDQYRVRIPPGYLDSLPQVARIERALATRPLRTLPCNNDLLAGNYVDDGRRLWLIDFEYAGNNDPCFELGNTCQELQFDESRLVEVCQAYFGAAEPNMLARMKLNMIMSDVGWTLWAAIQAQISTIDYDYGAWATERWARAQAKMASSELETWLAEVVK